MNEAAEAIRSAAMDDTNIIFGATVDERLTGQVWVTVVATGFGGRGRRSTRSEGSSGWSLPGLGRKSSGGDDDLDVPAFMRE